MSKWHPMSEGYPEKAGVYLVTTKKGFLCLGTLYHTLFGEPYWNGRMRDCVVAWQELPEPFREGENNE